MSTIENFNNVFKEKIDFFDELFRDKLKIAMDYRNINQEQLAHLCNKQSQNAVSKWLTKNEKYKSVPNALELLAISSILELSILFFMEPEMKCEEADFSLTPIEKLRKLKELTDFFVETSIITDCFTILDKIKKTSSIAVITTAAHNGSSRALNEYALLNKNTALFSGSRNIAFIEKYLQKNLLAGDEISEDRKLFLLFDDTEKIEPALIREIIVRYNNQYKFPIAFSGKSLKTIFEQNDIAYKVSDFYNLNVLLMEDIRKFIIKAFPAKTETEINGITPLLVGGIHEITEYIEKRRVNNYKKEKPSVL